MGKSIDPKVKKKALDYFFNNDVSYEAVVAKFKGKPTLQTLMRWVKSDERFKGRRLKWSYYSADIKTEAIRLYYKENMNIHQIQKKLKVTSYSSVLHWINQYKKYGKDSIMPKRKEEKLRPPKNNDALQKRLYDLELENDILREAFLLGDYPKAKGF